MNNYINVVLTGDENYVMPMGVAMYSVVKNLNSHKKARFFLLVSSWTKKEEAEIRKVKNCEIIIIPVEKYLHYFNTVDTKKMKLTYIKNLTPYYRLLIPKVLPQYVDKAFYLDSDMIVDYDLSDIYNLGSKNLLAAVIELLANAHRETVLSHLSEWREFAKFNKDHSEAPYFNAGFFLMNLSLARELNIFDDFITFLKKHPNPPYADQDTLNAVCGQKYSDKMVYLDPSWNVFCDMNYDVDTYFKAAYSYYSIRQSFANPRIYHYGGANKPWINKNILHYWNVWNNYYEDSPFYKSLLTNKPEHISKYWLFFCSIPLIRIKKAPDGSTLKTYLFGFLPIFKKYPKKLKIYLFVIPFIEYKNLRIKLFGLPIIHIKLSRKNRTL